MYAVITSGNQQFIVKENETLAVDKLNANPGDSVTFDNVLLVNDGKVTKIGKPTVEGANVVAEVIAQGRDKKITVFKYKRKTGYKVTKGHKQHQTIVKVTKIKA